MREHLKSSFYLRIYRIRNGSHAWLAAFRPLHFFFFPLLRHCHCFTSSPGDTTDLPGKTLLTSQLSLITDPFTHMILFTSTWRTRCLTCWCRSLSVCRGWSVWWVSAVRILFRSDCSVCSSTPQPLCLSESMSTLMWIQVKTLLKHTKHCFPPLKSGLLKSMTPTSKKNNNFLFVQLSMIFRRFLQPPLQKSSSNVCLLLRKKSHIF